MLNLNMVMIIFGKFEEKSGIIIFTPKPQDKQAHNKDKFQTKT